MKNNYFDCFLFTNNRGCDLIKKKTGIIKPEGEIVKERLFITPEYTTAKEIKKIRKELHLTQKEFAEFINCSKPTVERWERSEDVIRGPIVPFLKMVQKYPEYEQEVKVPEKVWPIRIWYKADYTGYEGLAEYMISHLLKKSTLAEQEFVCYDLEEIKYGTMVYN